MPADTADDLVKQLAAVPAGERVAVIDRRFVGHLHALRLALADPRFPAAAVPGAVAVAAEARSRLSDVVAGLPGDAGPDAIADGLSRSLDVHRPELGVLVAAVPADAAARAEAESAVAAVDDEAVRLRSAVKSRDGFFTTFFISPYSRYLARWCARIGLSPNQVTTASLLVAIAAAACAATGSRPGYIAAGVLLIASFVLDCADGQLARYSLRYSTLGAWLDATFDRAKEYAYYAGLALGAAANGQDVWALALGAMILQTVRHVIDFAFTEAGRDAAGGPATGPTAALSDRLDSVGWTVWARRIVVLPIGERWALIAVLTAATTPRTVFLVLLTGCAFATCYTTAGRLLRSVARRTPNTDRAAAALAELTDNGPLAETAARALAPVARRLPTRLTPVLALVGAGALLATASLSPPGSWWPVLAAATYALSSGVAVAIGSPPPARGHPSKGAPQDFVRGYAHGAVPWGMRGVFDWLVPPSFRAAEYLTVLVLAVRSGDSGVNSALPAAFCLVAAVAYHHYDTVYRIRGGAGAPPRRLVHAIGGHEGRVLVVTAAAALTHGRNGTLTFALAALAGVLALLVLSESIRFWVSSGAPAVHDETGEPA